ncbi:MAG: hypothetical protein M1834_005573 [Cirrosporium novae-zelandiae]|nr:MAG: hypothetical protein M1834_005573 [Cirrosporium novae-zelandiae]
MPPSDYTAPTRGALKLKGVKDSKIKKHKKKKEKKERSESAAATSGGEEEKAEASRNNQKKLHDALRDEDDKREEEDGDEGYEPGRQKTETEKHYEEMRRKRLNERLKREGIKTHKERVEELNRYLSNLSEHHDMPRIGPG